MNIRLTPSFLVLCLIAFLGQTRASATTPKPFLSAKTCMGEPALRASKTVVSYQYSTPASGIVGNVVAEISIKIANTGDSTLGHLQIIDNIGTQMGGGFVSVLSGPSVDPSSTATTNPTINGLFNGTTEANLFDGSSGRLAPGQQLDIHFTIEIDPNNPGAYHPLRNTATVEGYAVDALNQILTNPSTGGPWKVFDFTDGGANPLSSNPDAHGDTGGTDDPLYFILPNLHVSKSQVFVQAGSATQPEGTVQTNLFITFKNTGNTNLTNFSVTDNLAGLGCAFISLASPPTIFNSNATANPTLNATYNGTTNAQLLSGGGTLAPEQQITLELIILTNPNCASVDPTLINQATVSAMGLSPLTNGILVSLTKQSDSGLNPESNNAGAPGDLGTNSDPTPLYLPSLAAFKNIVSVAPAASCTLGNVDMAFKICAKNTGNVALDQISLYDPAMTLLGSSYVSLLEAPHVTSTTATTTPSALGFPDIFMQSGLLAPGQSVCVEYKMELNPNNNLYAVNSAYAEGRALRDDTGAPFISALTNAPVKATDNSDAGDQYESFNPGFPGDTGGNEDALLIQVPQIHISQQVVECIAEPTQAPTPGNAWVTFEIKIKNTGNVPLTNLQIQNNIAAQLGSAYLGIVGSPALALSTASTDPVLNPGFNGGSQSNLLNGSSGLLNPNQTLTYWIKILMDPDAPGALIPAYTQAAASGTGLNAQNTSVTVSDLSDNGSDPESINAAYPNHNTSACAEDDKTPVDVPVILASKELVKYFGNTEGFCDGELNAIFKIKMTNAGNVKLDKLSLKDDFYTQMGSAFIKTGSGYVTITASNATQNPTKNPAFNGKTQPFVFNGTGQLDRGQSIETEIFTFLDPSDPLAPSPLTNQAEVGGRGIRADGSVVKTPDLSGEKYVFDRSDAGNNPLSLNAGADGDTGGSNDPLQTCLPYLSVPPQDITFNACDPWPQDVDVWKNSQAGAVVNTCANNPIICWVFEEIETLPTGCGKNFKSKYKFTGKDLLGNEISFCATFTIVDNQPPFWDMLPMNKTVDCSDQNAIQTWLNNAGGAWVYDCGSDITVSHNLSILSGTCGGQTTVVFTATDQCGDASTASAILTVEDHTPPQLTGVPANLTLACGSALPSPTSGVTATDNCAANIAVAFENFSAAAKGTLSAAQEVPVNAATGTGFAFAQLSPTNLLNFRIAFSGLTGPVTGAHIHQAAAGLNGPVIADLVSQGFPTDHTSGFYVGFILLNPAQAIAFNNGKLYLNIHTSANPGGELRAQLIPKSCASNTINAYIWSAVDACQNSTAAAQIIETVDDIAPVFVDVPADLTIYCPESPAFTNAILANDCSGTDLSFVDNSTGSCPDGYQVTRTWTATDGCGNSSTASATIVVLPQPAILTVDFPADITVQAAIGATNAAVTYSYPIPHTTCADTTVQITLLSGPDSGELFPIGTTEVCFQVSDACGNTEDGCFNVTVIETQSTVHFAPLANKTIACHETVEFDIPTADTDCGGGIASIDHADAVTGSLCTGYQYVRTFTATDACGSVAQIVQTIAVLPDTTAPVFTLLPQDDVSDCISALPNFGTAEAEDLCSGATITHVDETVSGSCTDGYIYRRLFTATDGCGNHTTAAQTIFAAPDNTPPDFTFVPADQMTGCDSLINYGQAIAQDGCSGLASLTYFVTTNGPTDCHYVDSIQYGYDIYVHWVATDICHNTDTVTSNIWVLPGAGVGFIDAPKPLTVHCGEPLEWDDPVCMSLFGAVNVEVTETIDLNDCGAGTVVRTWKATDDAGNTALAQQKATLVQDSEPPVFEVLNPDVTIDCLANLPGDLPAVSDNCTTTGLIGLEYSDEIDGNKAIRTFTATDLCGNSAQISITYLADDQIVPVFPQDLQTKTIACGGPVEFDTPIVEECSDFTLTYEEYQETSPCTTLHIRLWKAVDVAGNENFTKQIIEETDLTAPEFSGLIGFKQAECGEPIVFDTPVVSDACNAFALTFADLTEQPACGNSGYSAIRTWTATDLCGNQSQQSQQILVKIDDIAPVIASDSLNTLYFTHDQYEAWTPSPGAIDDCSPTTTLHTAIPVDNCHFIYNWIVTDDCGNYTLAEQHIYLTDGDCAPLGVTDALLDHLSVQPNPFDPYLHLEWHGGFEQQMRYAVTDILGRTVAVGDLDKITTTIPTGDWFAGAYFVRIYTETARSAAIKVIKTTY